MASAKIGALHVSLGLDSASFTKGMDRAKLDIAGLQKSATVAFSAVAAAGTAAATAMGFAVKGALDHADALSKAAQKVGVATAALSRLEYAASFSDVSLEQLTGGLGRLSKSLADVAAGSKGPAATAFAALGIEVTDASGKLRASDEVFVDIADRFGWIEDGSTKTALAMNLFGKSGAELIPLLNSGRAGLQAMADESDRFGLTISGSTGKAAEQFNDTMGRVGKTMAGVTARITEAALPSLQGFADFLASPKFAEAATVFGTGLINVMSSVTQAIAGVTLAARDLFSYLNSGASNAFQGVSTEELQRRAANSRRILAKSDPSEGGYAELQRTLAAEEAALDARKFKDPIGSGATFSGVLGMQTPPTMNLAPLIADLDGFKTATEAAGSAQQQLQQIMTEGQSVFMAMRTPIESLQAELDKLGQLLNKGAIDWETYERARRSAILNNAADELGALGQVSGALASAFKDNKAFALANAAINTAQGMTKALATEGFLGIASAAAVGIAGAAQMMAIASTNLGAAAAPASVSSGVAAPQVPQATAGRSTVINLHGTPNTPTTLGMVGGLLEQLQEELRSDGRELVVRYRGA